MHKLIEWFTKNSVAANLLMVVIVAAGFIFGINKIILQEFPDYPSRTIQVQVQYRGSTPTEVEEAIVLRLEEALYDIEGLDELDARATGNAGSVSLTIADNYDLDRALDEVKNRVDTIRSFPLEAERPRVLPEPSPGLNRSEKPTGLPPPTSTGLGRGNAWVDAGHLATKPTGTPSGKTKPPNCGQWLSQ